MLNVTFTKAPFTATNKKHTFRAATLPNRIDPVDRDALTGRSRSLLCDVQSLCMRKCHQLIVDGLRLASTIVVTSWCAEVPVKWANTQLDINSTKLRQFVNAISATTSVLTRAKLQIRQN